MSFTLIEDGPKALPGSCYKCNSGTRRRYIDLNTQIEFHGACYLCDECIREMAQLLGMLTEEQSRELEAKTLEAESELIRVQRQLEQTEAAVGGFDNLRSFFGTSDDAVSVTADAEEGISEGEGELDDGKIGPPESTDDEDVVGLQSTNKSEFSFGI